MPKALQQKHVATALKTKPVLVSPTLLMYHYAFYAFTRLT